MCLPGTQAKPALAGAWSAYTDGQEDAQAYCFTFSERLVKIGGSALENPGALSVTLCQYFHSIYKSSSTEVQARSPMWMMARQTSIWNTLV